MTVFSKKCILNNTLQNCVKAKFMVNLIKSITQQRKIRDFMLTAAFYLSLAGLSANKAHAQTPITPEQDKTPDKNKTSLNYNLEIAIDNLSALIADEKTVTFYNDLAPSIVASLENKKGDGAKITASEMFVYDGSKITPALNTLMLECYKKVKNGGELFLKVGRDNTQGNDDLPPAVDYTADTVDDEAFSNNAPHMVLGYRKDGHFIELGTIQNIDFRDYAFIPNMQKIDFFAKGHLAILNKDNTELSTELTTHLGKHSQTGIADVNFMKNGIGAKASLQYDFKNDETKYLLRAYQKLKNGFALIEEIAHRGKECGVDFRLCAGKKGLQVFAMYNTEDKLLQLGTSYSFSVGKKISHTK